VASRFCSVAFAPLARSRCSLSGATELG
jgi:hypothetical protein